MTGSEFFNDEQLHQMVYGRPVTGVNLLGDGGVGPVASSVALTYLPKQLLQLLSARTAGDVQCTTGNLFYTVISGCAVLIHRTMVTVGARPSTFAHVLLGSPEILTLQWAVAMWDWDWNRSPRPADAQAEPLFPIQRVEFVAAARKGQRAAPTGSIPKMDQLLIAKLRRPAQRLVVIADLADRQGLLSGLINALGVTGFPDGFSTYESEYGADQKMLPAFVFADPRQGATGQAVNGVVVNLNTPAPGPAAEIRSVADILLRVSEADPHWLGLDSLRSRGGGSQEVKWLLKTVDRWNSGKPADPEEDPPYVPDPSDAPAMLAQPNVSDRASDATSQPDTGRVEQTQTEPQRAPQPNPGVPSAPRPAATVPAETGTEPAIDQPGEPADQRQSEAVQHPEEQVRTETTPVQARVAPPPPQPPREEDFRQKSGEVGKLKPSALVRELMRFEAHPGVIHQVMKSLHWYGEEMRSPAHGRGPDLQLRQDLCDGVFDEAAMRTNVPDRTEFDLLLRDMADLAFGIGTAKGKDLLLAAQALAVGNLPLQLRKWIETKLPPQGTDRDKAAAALGRKILSGYKFNNPRQGDPLPQSPHPAPGQGPRRSPFEELSLVWAVAAGFCGFALLMVLLYLGARP